MLRKYIILVLLISIGFSTAQSKAAEYDDLDVIELELDRSKRERETQRNAPTEREMPKEQMTDFSGLGTLAPFSDISVIQKRYMPKTGRFQLFGGATVLTNNPFFNTLGASVKGSYFLTESWGIELNYMGLTTSDRQITEELRDIQGVKTENLVYPKSFMGVDLMFVPIYGKMSWFNEKIIPFDLYFSAGYGTTNTQMGEDVGTIHLAAGQIFALSKAYAVRWDFSWNFFNAKGIDGNQNTFNNLFLTVGMSWFFPEASYR